LLAAIVLLTLASVLCGSARSMLFPVIARGVQGIGGGILLGTVFAAVADLFPDPKLRLRWLVLVTSTFGARHRDHGRAARAFLRNVHRPLDSYQATQWLKSFASPDLLIDRAEQSALIERLVAAGQPGDAMMHSARMALVASIHVGLVVAAMAAFVGLCLAWFVPAVRVVYGDAKQQGV
jgi:hypothetical protein